MKNFILTEDLLKPFTYNYYPKKENLIAFRKKNSTKLIFYASISFQVHDYGSFNNLLKEKRSAFSLIVTRVSFTKPTFANNKLELQSWVYE